MEYYLGEEMQQLVMGLGQKSHVPHVNFEYNQNWIGQCFLHLHLARPKLSMFPSNLQ